MKKLFLVWIGPLLALLWVLSSLFGANRGAGALETFARLPVLADGRIKPLGTVARTSLLILHGRTTLRLADGKVMPPPQWLAEVLFDATSADTRPLFLINNPEVLALFGWERAGRKFFSFSELEPSLAMIDAQGEMANGVEAARRTPYQTAILNLRNALYLYQRLKNSLRPAGAGNFTEEIATYRGLVSAGLPPLRDGAERGAGNGASANVTGGADVGELPALLQRYNLMVSVAFILPVPSSAGREWTSMGTALLSRVSGGEVPAAVSGYAAIGDAWHEADPGAFGEGVESLAGYYARVVPTESRHAAFEEIFNRIDPFYLASGLYVLSFLLICVYWLRGDVPLRSGVLLVMIAALGLHTFGLAARMWLQGRPPVTNLYSSAVFIGWATVLLGLVLERFQKDGVGAACSAVTGFVTLVIAMHLAGRGDTLEMLQAVLDTNIWLATHVVAITIGYSAMFLAGMLAMLYVLRDSFAGPLAASASRSLTRMIYGVLCFATLFSFVGTILGGIWADQSWGRFWGWDPKENGALLIVLWCAITLHGRLAGVIRERGLVACALFGNIVTAFSWFGVNMLGVGLHSYGFMDRAVPWLAGFIGLQATLILLVLRPAFGAFRFPVRRGGS